MKPSLVKIGSYVSIKGGKRLPKGENFSPNKTDHPYIRARDIKDGKIIFNDPIYINSETYQKIKRYTVKAGDICITIVGANVGDVGQVPESLDGANLTENAVKLVDWSDDLDRTFAKYCLLTPECRNQMQALAAGAAQPKLGIYKVAEVQVPLLPIDQQKNVAKILSNLDQLIENYSKRIDLLDKLSRALYRRWFKDFISPFADDKSTMVESNELGLIPQGWQVYKLRDLISEYIGGGWGEDTPGDDHSVNAYVIRGTDIPELRVGETTQVPLRWHKDSNISSRNLEPEDIVFEVSGGSKDQPVGRALIVSKLVLENLSHPAICASFCKKIRVRKDLVSPYQILLAMYDWYEDGTIPRFEVQSTGITNFKFEAFLDSVYLAVPPKHQMEDFHRQLECNFNLIASLGKKNDLLGKIKSSLISKLVFGEIEVSDLSKNIEEDFSSNQSVEVNERTRL